MSISIEWFTATQTSIDVLSASEPASDNQRAIDDGGTPQTIALELGNGGGGACITGTPAELLTFLTQAITLVADHWTDNPMGERGIEVKDLVSWEHEDGRTIRSIVLDVSEDGRMIEADYPSRDGGLIQLTVGEVELVDPSTD